MRGQGRADHRPLGVGLAADRAREAVDAVAPDAERVRGGPAVFVLGQPQLRDGGTCRSVPRFSPSIQDLPGRAGLAHARLSIIDLSPTGAQPMRTDDRRFVATYNGEIYNFPELRRELEAAGERFRGSPETNRQCLGTL